MIINSKSVRSLCSLLQINEVRQVTFQKNTFGTFSYPSAKTNRLRVKK